MRQPAISIETIGVLRVTGPNGEDLTPRGSRPRAVLAIVALSPRMQASRRWVESLVWSDRAPAQASGSLRQALAEIRLALGAWRGALYGDRSDIALDQHVFSVDLLTGCAKARAAVAHGRQLLEGVDVPSEGFEDWLRAERGLIETKLERPVAAPTRPEAPQRSNGYGGSGRNVPLVRMENAAHEVGFAGFLAEAVRAQLERSLTESSHVVSAVDPDRDRARVEGPGGHLSVRMRQTGDRIAGVVALTDAESGGLLWSRRLDLDARDPQACFDTGASVALEGAEAFAERINTASTVARANALANAALKEVFSFDPRRIRAADAMLEQANEVAAYAPRPALRALCRAFLFLERASDVDTEELQAEARFFVKEALSLDPSNTLALGFAADAVETLENDANAALELSYRALRLNAGAGYARASLGALELRRGRIQSAFCEAGRGRLQLRHTAMEVFADMRFCVAAMAAGRMAEAELAAADAAMLAPFSSPPLRHLLFLRWRAGDLEGARSALEDLRRIEPDFTIDAFRRDPSYPIATIRKIGFSDLPHLE